MTFEADKFGFTERRAKSQRTSVVCRCGYYYQRESHRIEAEPEANLLISLQPFTPPNLIVVKSLDTETSYRIPFQMIGKKDSI
jgi:hypothetical protein